MRVPDKITAILLAGIMVCATFAFVLPAMADDATQTASVSKLTTAVTFKALDNSTDITGWTFTGTSGETVEPENSNGEQQDKTDGTKPVAKLNNTNAAAMSIYFNISQFSDTSVAAITNEDYNVTAYGTGPTLVDVPTTEQQFDTGFDAPANSNTTCLWLELTLGTHGTATANFLMESEVV